MTPFLADSDWAKTEWTMEIKLLSPHSTTKLRNTDRGSTSETWMAAAVLVLFCPVQGKFQNPNNI